MVVLDLCRGQASEIRVVGASVSGMDFEHSGARFRARLDIGG